MLEGHPHHSAASERDLHYPSFALRRLTPHIGAEITGIDLSKPLEPQQEADVRRDFGGVADHALDAAHAAVGLQYGHVTDLLAPVLLHEGGNILSPDGDLLGECVDVLEVSRPRLVVEMTDVSQEKCAGAHRRLRRSQVREMSRRLDD